MKRTTLALRGLTLAAAAALAGCGGAETDEFQHAERASRLSVTTNLFLGVYTDGMSPGWGDWSWAPHSLSNPAPVAIGTASIAVTYAPYTGLNFGCFGMSGNGLDFLDLYANGGSTADARINVRLRLNNQLGPALALGPYCDGGSIPPGAFVRCQVPLVDLGWAPGKSIQSVVLQEPLGRALPTMYFDQIGFTRKYVPPPLPAQVTGLTAVAAPGSVALTWNAAANAVVYFVYRDGHVMGAYLGTTFTDTSAVAGATYTYTVSGDNMAGEGPPSAPLTVTVPTSGPPITIVILQ